MIGRLAMTGPAPSLGGVRRNNGFKPLRSIALNQLDAYAFNAHQPLNAGVLGAKR
jgi:hypothetical protein